METRNRFYKLMIVSEKCTLLTDERKYPKTKRFNWGIKRTRYSCKINFVLGLNFEYFKKDRAVKKSGIFTVFMKLLCCHPVEMIASRNITI